MHHPRKLLPFEKETLQTGRVPSSVLCKRGMWNAKEALSMLLLPRGLGYVQLLWGAVDKRIKLLGSQNP